MQQPTKAPVLAIAVAGLVGGIDTAQATVSDEQYRALEKRLLQLEKRLEESEASKASPSADTAAPPAAPAGALGASEQSTEVKQLKQKVSLLERKVEINEETAEKVRKEVPKIDAGSGGFKWSSADGQHALRLGGYIQADGDFFMDDHTDDSLFSNSNEGDKFWIRRGRITLDGQMFRYVNFRIMPDFSQGNVRLFDAYADLHYFDFAQLTGGKMKSPINLERFQSATNLQFVERAYPTQLAPNRDVGMYLHGEFAKPGYETGYGGPFTLRQDKDWITYGVGVFDDSPDNGFTDTNTGDSFSFQGRVFAHPFQHTGITPVEGLGIGVAGSYQDPNNLALANLVSIGQNPIVRYTAGSTSTAQTFVPSSNGGGSIVNTTTVTGSAVADGDGYRLQPQAYWYWGPFGAMAEYALSTNELANFRSVTAGKSDPTVTNAAVKQSNTAWQIATTYVLTGENNSFQGVKPRHEFDPFAGTWGAWQIGARFTELDVDNDTFRNFGTADRPVYLISDPRASVSKASTWGADVSWWLNNNVRVMADYQQTSFQGGAASRANPLTVTSRQMEKVWFTRLQVAW